MSGAPPRGTARPLARAAEPDTDGYLHPALAWGGVALLSAAAALSGLLELMFVPLYAGSVVFPVSVVAAVVGNVVLPRLGRGLAGRALGALLPVLAWLLAVLVPSMVQRAEGDLFVIAAFNQQYVYYGLVLAGTIAGFVTVLSAAPPSRAAARR